MITNSNGKVPKIYHGTTTVGLVCVDGVVFATDTRVTADGYVAHKKGKKLYKIADNLAMTIAGTVADAQNVIDIIRFYVKKYELEHQIQIPIKAAASLTSNIFSANRMFPLITQVIMGGVNGGVPSLFQIDFFGSLTEEKVFSTGSGSPIAYSILESSYSPSLNTKEGAKIAAKSVLAAMKRDTATGESLDVGIIDSNGYRELDSEAKNELIKDLW
ncbi:MAG: proteasome subunit beta [Nitrososphaeria archaeon]